MNKKNSALLFPLSNKIIDMDPASVLKAHFEFLKDKPDVPASIKQFFEEGANATGRHGDKED